MHSHPCRTLQRVIEELGSHLRDCLHKLQICGLMSLLNSELVIGAASSSTNNELQTNSNNTGSGLQLLILRLKLDDEWPESIFHHVGSQSVSYLLSVQCEVLSRVS